MAGYIYCMWNNHWTYGKYLKLGYTERTSEQRRLELCRKWRCAFKVLWDLDVYEPAKAELFLHSVLDRFRVDYEFFEIDVETVKALAEKFFDENWREIEGKEVLLPNLVDLAEHDRRGFLLESEDPLDINPNGGADVNHGPDTDGR